MRRCRSEAPAVRPVPSPLQIRLLPWLLAGLFGLGGLAALSAPAVASGGHGDEAPPKKAGKESVKEGTKEGAKEGGKEGGKEGNKEPAKAAERAAAKTPADSMDALREKLAERLGAVKPPESRSPYVVRVANKAEGPAGGGAAAAGTLAPSAAARSAAKPRLPTAAEAGALVEAGHAHGAGPGKDAHWSYDGENGPGAWAKLKPEFEKCATGQRQSPIDIRGGIAVQLQPIQFDYRPSGFSVIDNGHTVQVNLPPGNALTVGGRRYDLLQFHFHRPSEERVNGRQFDMVAHLVHKDPDGKLAVVAVLLERGSAQPLIQAVWNALPLEKGEDVAAPGNIDLNQLLPEDRRYFTYMGSLTTPPCSEGVLWMVMKQPVQLSNDQLSIFSRLYPMNARPIQQVSGRLIKESN